MKVCVVKDTVIITLAGEIDHYTSDKLREFIDRTYQKKRVKNIILDFKQVEFMDSAGIGLLMGRYKNVSIVGGSIALIHVNKKVDKLLNISGLYKIFKSYNSQEEALHSLT